MAGQRHDETWLLPKAKCDSAGAQGSCAEAPHEAAEHLLFMHVGQEDAVCILTDSELFGAWKQQVLDNLHLQKMPPEDKHDSAAQNFQYRFL